MQATELYVICIFYTNTLIILHKKYILHFHKLHFFFIIIISLIFCPRTLSWHPLTPPISVRSHPLYFNVIISLFPLSLSLYLVSLDYLFRPSSYKLLLCDHLSSLSLVDLSVSFFPLLSRGLRPSIKSFPLNICPIQFFCHCLFCFDRTSLFVHYFKYFLENYFIPSAYLFQSSPQPCRQFFQSVDFILQQCPCLTSIQYNRSHKFYYYSLLMSYSTLLLKALFSYWKHPLPSQSWLSCHCGFFHRL